VKNSVKKFLKLDLDKLPIRKIRELLLNFNPDALKIQKNRKKLFLSSERSLNTAMDRSSGLDLISEIKFCISTN